MTSSGLIAIAAALCIALSTIAPAIAQGMTASKAMDAIARQPEAAGDIRSTLILSSVNGRNQIFATSMKAISRP